MDVKITALKSNANQPRGTLRGMKELVASIAEVGIIAPIVVVEDGKHYRIVDGHRRAAAAKEAGLDTVPVVVAASDTAALETARLMAANTVRDDLTATECARGIQTLIDLGVKPTQVTKMTGVKKAGLDAAQKVAASKMEIPAQATLEEAAALVEFGDDKDSAERLTRSLGTGQFKHEIERLRQNREKAAKVTALEVQAKAEGLRLIADGQQHKQGTERLKYLMPKVTPESHKECSGHAAFIVTYYGQDPEFVYVCTDAVAQHNFKGGSGYSAPPKDKEFERKKRERRAGWKAATVVRREFAREVIAKRGSKTIDAEAVRFLAKYAKAHGLPGERSYGMTELINEFLAGVKTPLQTLLALAFAQQEKAIFDTIKANGGTYPDSDYSDGSCWLAWTPYFDFLADNGYIRADAERETFEEAQARWDKKRAAGQAAIAAEIAEGAPCPAECDVAEDERAECRAEADDGDEPCQWLMTPSEQIAAIAEGESCPDSIAELEEDADAIEEVD